MNITRENIDTLNAVVKVDISKDDYSDKVEKILSDYPAIYWIHPICIFGNKRKTKHCSYYNRPTICRCNELCNGP